jgi:hypothetical protein
MADTAPGTARVRPHHPAAVSGPVAHRRGGRATGTEKGTGMTTNGHYRWGTCTTCGLGCYASHLTDAGVCRDWRGCQEREGQAALKKVTERTQSQVRLRRAGGVGDENVGREST